MTVSGTDSRERYDGNGVTVSFPITFVYGEDADINVTHIDALGIETAWVLDGVGDTGFTIVSGAVVANTAPEDETELVIYRVTPITQLVDYVENRATPATVTEDTLDKLTMITQELEDASDRAMTLPVTAEESVSAELPLPEALKLIRWNAAADALINVTSAELNGEILASSFVVDKYVDGVDFTAGVTTQLVLTSVPGSENNTQIYFDGVYQEKGTYSLSATTITFGSAIPGGVSGVEVMYIVGAPPTVPADASVTTVKLGGIDTIAEETVGAGVAIDGFGIKDNAPNPTSWPSFATYLSGNQNILAASPTKIQFDTEEFDTNSNFDAVTNYRFTAPVKGKYLILGLAQFLNCDGGSFSLQIYKNGVVYRQNADSSALASRTIPLNEIVSMNATDYIELYAVSATDTDYNINGSASRSLFSGSRIA